MPVMAELSVAKLVGALSRGQTVNYVHVATACAFAYDHFTTLADEVRLIWRAPWGLGKTLFLASRYLVWPDFIFLLYTELFNVPESQCHVGLVYVTWSTSLGIFFAQNVLVLRTWAIWGGRRIIVQALLLFQCTITGVNWWIIVRFIRHTRVINVAGITGCVVVSSSKSIASSWITVSCFELVIVTLTVVKAIEAFRFGSSTLLVSLYRDGIMYYVCLSAIGFINLIFIISAPDEYIVLLAVLQHAFHVILSCRIILHLRGLRPMSPSASAGIETVSVWFGAKIPHKSGSSASAA